MTIQLTEREKKFLSSFAKKQYAGAADNVGTMTPIHIVERIRESYIPSEDGDAWIYCNDYDCEQFEDFDAMLEFIKEASDKTYPNYSNVEYEEVNGVWIDSKEAYCRAYNINARRCRVVRYTEPVAFFFIREEAVRYKDEYQAHNCENCRIFTYGLGYSNNGDLPVFRALLLRMGEAINNESM